MLPCAIGVGLPPIRIFSPGHACLHPCFSDRTSPDVRSGEIDRLRRPRSDIGQPAGCKRETWKETCNLYIYRGCTSLSLYIYRGWHPMHLRHPVVHTPLAFDIGAQVCHVKCCLGLRCLVEVLILCNHLSKRSCLDKNVRVGETGNLQSVWLGFWVGF